MFSTSLAISLASKLVTAGYGTARDFYFAGHVHSDSKRSFDIPQVRQRQSYLANMPAPYHGHSRAVTNATFSGADGRSEMALTLPLGASCGRSNLFKTTTAYSHLVHVNSPSGPLYFRTLYCANANQVSTDPYAGRLPTPSLMHWGIIRMLQMHAERLSDQPVNAVREDCSVENR